MTRENSSPSVSVVESGVDAPTSTSPEAGPPSSSRARLGFALAAMFFGAFSLVTSEFLPPGVLTEVAGDLGVTEGMVGLTVSVTAVTALAAALGLNSVFPRADRRRVLVVLALAATVSNVLVALTPSFVLLLVARLLLGFAVGGFWSMALVVASRLVEPGRIGRAMMCVNAGTTIATVAGVPLAVLLSGLAGWRTTFLVASCATLVAALAVRLSLPRILPEAGTTGSGSMGRAFVSPGVAVGILGVVTLVAGHFAGYTFVRPALTGLFGASEAMIPVLLAVFGVGGLVGNFLIGALADKHLGLLLLSVPTGIGLGILGLVFSGGAPVLGVAAIGLWGISFGGLINVVNVWVGRVLPHDIAAGSGWTTASFQIGIILGSAVGGVGVDALGLAPTYLVAALAALIGGVLLRISLTRVGRNRSTRVTVPC